MPLTHFFSEANIARARPAATAESNWRAVCNGCEQYIGIGRAEALPCLAAGRLLVVVDMVCLLLQHCMLGSPLEKNICKKAYAAPPGAAAPRPKMHRWPISCSLANTVRKPSRRWWARSTWCRPCPMH
ncbi:hypothetical protein VARIO8X_90479 [Burkholderiales bacterium 8X]|nr:hypothetical protein VARIO8X_90479 [Burkholderiales bacterium 8X]